MDGPLEFPVRLKVDVKLLTQGKTAKVFKAGSIQTVVANERTGLNIKGYPSTVVIDQSWEPVFYWEEVKEWG